jgi:hypothetical protein
MRFHWRKYLAVAVLSWSVLDMVGAAVFLTRSRPAKEHQLLEISSTPASPASSSEGYCDGDCIFCSTTIKHTPTVGLVVLRVQVSRLEVADVSVTTDGFLKPVYHPPQS